MMLKQLASAGGKNPELCVVHANGVTATGVVTTGVGTTSLKYDAEDVGSDGTSVVKTVFESIKGLSDGMTDRSMDEGIWTVDSGVGDSSVGDSSVGDSSVGDSSVIV